MNRHLTRILAMQILYEWDFRNKKNFQAIKKRNSELFKQNLDLAYLDKLVLGAKQHLTKLDKQILAVAPEFPIEQIANIDRAILRLSIYELETCLETPSKVIINEAVEIAKQFGGANSYKFVNGVLGTIYKKSQRYQLDQKNKQDEDNLSPTKSHQNSLSKKEFKTIQRIKDDESN